jgi:UDP-2,3-diacylglucosamine pyrophosphatase LpxH
MLAIISDLHFCDKTAYEDHVDIEAFGSALDDIYEEAADVHKRRLDKTNDASPCHVDLVLLGDVFDLLRTAAWFDVPVAERPWGSVEALEARRIAPGAPVLGHAHRILDTIIERNPEVLAVLKREPPPGVTVRRILLPGNHDRLALHDDTLYAKMRAALGAEADEQALANAGIHLHRLEMREYGVLARHGHEWDFFNFESYDPAQKTAEYVDDQYLPAPIGDPITTEIAARVPYEIDRELRSSTAFDQAEKDRIRKRLQRVEDVRPLLSSIVWVYQEAARLHESCSTDAKRRDLSRALQVAIPRIVGEFRELAFYKEWLRRHDHFHILHPFTGNPAGALDDALRVLEKVDVDTVEKLAPAFASFVSLATSGEDQNRTGAAREHLDRVGDHGLRFVVYGHTHEAEQVALSAGVATMDMYLNTGTFRQRIFLTDDQKGFIPSDYTSFVYFLREDEAAFVRAPHGELPGPAFTASMDLSSR